MAVDRSLFMQALTDYTADEFRNLFDALYPTVGPQGSGLLVTPTGTVSMNLLVSPGYAIVPTKSGLNKYLARIRSQEQVTITPAAAQPRIDLVVFSQHDTALGDADDVGKPLVVTGVASSSPVAPALPAGTIPLAQVAVAASAVNIGAGAITDTRVPAGPAVLLDPTVYLNATVPNAYPVGVSLMSNTAGQGSGGGWPIAAANQIWTVKAAADRAAQLCFRNSTAANANEVWYRQGSGTTWAAWQRIIEDTGWVAVPLAAGYTGTCNVRRVNGIVYWQGQVNGSFAVGSTQAIVAAGGVPVGFRGTSTYRMATLCGSSGAVYGLRGFLQNSSGSLSVNGGAVASTYAEVDALGGYPADA